MADFISIENCRIESATKTIIENIDWHFASGEAWLITGSSGGGKADFVRALSGSGRHFVPNASGSDVSLFSSVFQDSTEVVSLESAAALIEEEHERDESDYMDKIDEGRTGRRYISEVLGGDSAISARLETLPQVKLCGVEKILDRGLKFMSTGEIRRTLLCRALLSGKKLLVLSDPFAGLDAESRRILLEFFDTVVKKQLSGNDSWAFPCVILCMERMVEIPKSINCVLEFSDNRISFCGTREDYDALIAEREKQRSESRAEEKSAFARELNAIRSGDVLSEKHSVPDDTPLVEFRNVNVGWGDHRVLRNVNWTVHKGEHWLVRGPNGSGKTTLLELVTGDNQQVYANDVSLFGRRRGTGETIWDIKAKLGIVSYRLHVDYRMVGGFDLESVIISGFRDSIGLYEPKTDVEMQAAKKWLALGGFTGRENEAFSSLSYGEQRAVLILRAAVKQPPLLILDEPCHALDEDFRRKILDLMELIAESGTTTILHVTHDPTEVLDAEKHILELCPSEDPMYRIIER